MNAVVTKPPVLILHASGSNRDHDAAYACELAGGAPEIVHIQQLRARERELSAYRMLVVPGGFSYGDALGAGRLMALDLQVYFADAVQAFIAAGYPVLGICNGFQALVKAGILPGVEPGQARPATLTHNRAGRFECRWVTLRPDSSSVCVWTQGITDLIDCPIAHGEGRFVTRDAAVLQQLCDAGQVALTYGAADGAPANGTYPLNPNGSEADIAGVCNARGNVLGLMPHPEDHVVVHQGARWTRHVGSRLGLGLFQAGMRYASEL